MQSQLSLRLCRVISAAIPNGGGGRRSSHNRQRFDIRLRCCRPPSLSPLVRLDSSCVRKQCRPPSLSLPLSIAPSLLPSFPPRWPLSLSLIISAQRDQSRQRSLVRIRLRSGGRAQQRQRGSPGSSWPSAYVLMDVRCSCVRMPCIHLGLDIRKCSPCPIQFHIDSVKLNDVLLHAYAVGRT